MSFHKSLYVKITYVEYLVLGNALRALSILAVGIGLPGADVNLGVLLVAEVPKQEYIALVMVALLCPALVQGDTIEVLGVWVRVTHYLYLVEGDVYLLASIESCTQVIDVLLLGLFLVFNLVGQRDAVAGLALNDLARDDECIVAEHCLKEVNVLLIVRGAELLHVVKDELSAAQVGYVPVFLYNIHIKIHTDGKVEAGEVTLFVKAHYCLLVVFAFLHVSRVHWLEHQWYVAHLIAGARGDAMLYDLVVEADEWRVVPQTCNGTLHALWNAQRGIVHLSPFLLSRIGLCEDIGDNTLHLGFDDCIVDAIRQGDPDYICSEEKRSKKGYLQCRYEYKKTFHLSILLCD